MLNKKLLALFIGVMLFHSTLLAQFKNHGPQVFAAAIQGSHFVTGADGKEYVFTVVRGLPAQLVGYNLETGEKIINSVLTGTDGSWDMELSSDGILYMSGNGKMYSYTLGDSAPKDLGIALPGQKVIWDLVAGKDGKIYGGTYPDCQVYEYNPKTGFVDVGNGALQEGENYVRSLVYDPKMERIFAGIGSHAAFIELDLKSKKKLNILSDQDKDHDFVYDLELVSGVKGGDRLIAWLNSSKGLETLIYNLKTKKYEKRFSSIEVKSIAKQPNSNKIFYTAGGTVYYLDFADQGLEPKPISKVEGRGRAGFFDKEGNFKVLTNSHKVYTINPNNGEIKNEMLLDVPKSPISIQSIFWGPDNKVWVSGYLAGNHGTFDPITGVHTDYPGLHQTEGMNSVGNKIYFGNYTHAELFSYDVTKPWNLSQGNPKFLGAIKDQDRPFAVLPLSNNKEVLFGTVPPYGQLGGAITHLDVSTDKFVTYSDIIPNQSIVSLIEIDGKVIGGSSISGGLGGVPTAKRAKLFEWDVKNKKVLWTDSIDNHWSISGLFKGPDGGLWGFADGTLVKYDLKNKKVVFKKEVQKYDQYPSHIWRNGLAVSHENGLIYFTLGNKFYSFDPESKDLKELRNNANLMIQGDGKIYFRDGTDLWSYTPEGY